MNEEVSFIWLYPIGEFRAFLFFESAGFQTYSAGYISVIFTTTEAWRAGNGGGGGGTGPSQKTAGGGFVLIST